MQHSDSPTETQKLSQLMDGEWHDLNPSDCVAAVCSDDLLKSKWTRYHLIRDVMKNEPASCDKVLVSRICAAIADEETYSNITPFNLAEGPAGSGIRSSGAPVESTSENQSDTGQGSPSFKPGEAAGGSSWLRTGLTGFALAASVAAVTVVGMTVWQGQAGPGARQGAPLSIATALDGRDSVAQRSDDGRFDATPRNPLPEVDFVANTGKYWVTPMTAERVSNENRLNMLLSQHIENSPTGVLAYSRLVGYDERAQER